ncbi:MAG: UpxY family transcription antiterminator, partial [Acidobacteriia bacterium]|nr:UpxY family transcription antiterminator [Terriglobia bacterium]
MEACKKKGGALYNQERMSTLSAKAEIVIPQLWYAVHTRSNFERQVQMEIDGNGLECYLPSYVEEHQWKDRKKKVTLPLFPGYLFVRLRDVPSERFTVIKSRGVVRIVGAADRIEPVAEEEIAAVRRILDANLACHGHPFLRAGMRVRVKKGPLRGLDGFLVRIKNSARLVISVNLIAKS